MTWAHHTKFYTKLKKKQTKTNKTAHTSMYECRPYNTETIIYNRGDGRRSVFGTGNDQLAAR